MEEPIFLQSICKDYLWGGNRLREEFGKQSDSEIIAESWELATHPDGSSIIRGGTYDGKNLQEFLDEVGSGVLGANCAGCKTMPVMIKLIDAKQNLSIQVHPDDAYAQRVEGEPGKTEMWYILDCTPGASLYYDVKEPVSKETFRASIENQTLTDLLCKKEVKPGELYFIPAGTLHAIGAGILLAEIQQNSNTTYRVYDYGRRGADGKLRPLHIEKALDVANLEPTPMALTYPSFTIPGGHFHRLHSCHYFTTDLMLVDDTVTSAVTEESFHHLLALSGNAVLETQQGTYPFPKGTSVLLLANSGRYYVKGACQYLATKVDEPVMDGE